MHEVIFFLPFDTPIDKAQDEYKKAMYSKSEYVGKNIYLPDCEPDNYSPRIFYPPKKAIEIVDKLTPYTSVVAWNFEFIGVSFSDLATFLEKLNALNCTLITIEPRLVYNISEPIIKILLEEAAKHRNIETQNTDVGVIKQRKYPKYMLVSSETVSNMRKDKKQGMSIDDIAKKYQTGIYQTRKHTDDIPGVCRLSEHYYKTHKLNNGKMPRRFRKEKVKLQRFFEITENIKLNDLIKMFLAEKPSIKTRVFYQSRLAMLYSFIKTKYGEQYYFDSCCSIDAYKISEFLDKLKEEKYEDKTIYTHYFILNGWFKFLCENGYAICNPMKNVWKPRVSKSLCKTEHLESEQLQQLFALIKKDLLEAEYRKLDENIIFLLKQNYVIMYLLATTGLRSGSVFGLKIDDFHYGRKENLRVHVKGDYYEKISLPKNTLYIVLEFLKKYSSYAPASWSVFRQNADTRNALQNRIATKYLKTLFKRLEIDIPARLHVFRTTFAVECHKNGMTLSVIRDKLLHSDISTTNAYLKKMTKYSEVEKMPQIIDDVYAVFPEGNQSQSNLF